MASGQEGLPSDLRVDWRFTGRVDGDLGLSRTPAERAAAQEAVLAGHWNWLRQVHGASCAWVADPIEGAEGDALATDRRGEILSVRTADCVPVLLWAGSGAVAAVHAGWRGLISGVLAETVAVLARHGHNGLCARIGPCIGPGCYPFGAVDLDRCVDVLGHRVSVRNDRGEPALDLLAGVKEMLGRSGVKVLGSDPPCTACAPGWYSHRARSEPERQVGVVRLVEGSRGG